MSISVHDLSPRKRHLAAVGTGRHAAATTTPPAPARPVKPVLPVLARLDVEQARKFVLELDTTAASVSPLLAMFLLGKCAGHLQAVLDVIDAAVQP